MKPLDSYFVRSYTDERGTVRVMETCYEIPFAVRRVFWFTDCSKQRGGNHKAKGDYLIVAQKGACTVVLDDAAPYFLGEHAAMYVPEGYRVTLDKFSQGAMIMILSSKHYHE